MLNESMKIGMRTAENRVVFQPMEGCDCTPDGCPGELTKKKYLAFAESGAGIIWMEASAVCPEGRTNPGQMQLTEENLPVYRQFVTSLREKAAARGSHPLFILQLTHSGRQSMTPMIAYRNEVYEARRPMKDEYVVSDEYLSSLPALFAKTAALAVKAGFDGVDVKSCHGYLMQELLSAFSRPGTYGGSFENRTRLLLDCTRAVRAAVPDDFLVVTRLGISDMIAKPWGFGTDENGAPDLAEPMALIGLLREAGSQMLNVTIGNPYYNPHINRPFRKGAYVPPEKPETGLARFAEVEREIKRRYPDLPLVGSGLSYYRGNVFERAEELLAQGVCDFVGFGRMTLAYPMFYRDFLTGHFAANRTCVTCSRCTTLMRNHRVSGCAIYDPYYKALYDELNDEEKKK